MKLRGIDFSKVLGASGVQGFFGEGYWFHRLLNRLFFGRFGLKFEGVESPSTGKVYDMTFVAKTTTLHAREGNMKLDSGGIMPLQLFPDCIRVRRRRRAVLNAVGLSGPGLDALLADGRWQRREKPFMLSFMSVAESPEERAEEFHAFVRRIKRCGEGRSWQSAFRAPFGIQINESCPNTGHDPVELAEEALGHLDIMAELNVPLLVKVNALMPIEVALRIGEHPACDGFCVSNTIHWDDLPRTEINRKAIWGTDVSPLAKYGGGGLSGRPLFPLVFRWVTAMRARGYNGAINAGGGILTHWDAEHLLRFGADSVFIGSMAMLYPFWVQKTIYTVNDRADVLDWRRSGVVDHSEPRNVLSFEERT